MGPLAVPGAVEKELTFREPSSALSRAPLHETAYAGPRGRPVSCLYLLAKGHHLRADLLQTVGVFRGTNTGDRQGGGRLGKELSRM